MLEQINNKVKGEIAELNEGEEWCSITLDCGYRSERMVNLSMKRPQYESLIGKYNVGHKVICNFYLTSNKKHDRWHTNAILLNIYHDQNQPARDI